MDEINSDVDSGVRELPVTGFIRFSIKAEDTENNDMTHKAFKEFCRVECGNDYTLGIRTLLKAYEDDYRFESLWEKIQEVNSRIDKLEPKKEVKKEEVEEEGFF